MDSVLDKRLPEPGLTRAVAGLSRVLGGGSDTVEHAAACYHCGEPCRETQLVEDQKSFCCQGCLFVHDLLKENGMEQFYGLSRHPGVKVKAPKRGNDWAYLDDPEIQNRLLDFSDGRTNRITFHVPGIHCVACVWLLENLFRLLPGIGKSEVNFPRRELSVRYEAQGIRLSQLVGLLVSIGYEPELNYARLDKPPARATHKRAWLQIGVAGFAFGNIMLFSLPAYLGMDKFSGPAFKTLFGYLGLVLAAPVLIYSAADYWRAAGLALRSRILTLEVPIALGLFALYSRSLFEVIWGRGEGYADSLAGLVFLLLCGRAFQQVTHERLAFDRDYKSFFPLSIKRLEERGERNVALSSLEVGDRVVVRNGELIPADSRLVSGCGLIDYSFVTGESEPVEKNPGDYLYAGGQQIGSRIEIQTVKPVSQSYLTSLWNHDAFAKKKREDLNTLTNRYSRRFTKIVIGIAITSALFWMLRGDASRGFKAFTSVLIVACPCALALAAPFALGTAQRALGKKQVYLKNIFVLERLAEVNAIVFDKTGTLTCSQGLEVRFEPGRFGQQCLSTDERAWVCALAAQSTHPHSRQIATALSNPTKAPAEIRDFAEVPGGGLKGRIAGHLVQLGSRTWLERLGIHVDPHQLSQGSTSFVAIDGKPRGAFVFSNALRPQTEEAFADLGGRYELSLLSGDNERERSRFLALFGKGARLHFNQGPLEKLAFIQKLQEGGKRVMMVGDGLNDSGALRQSDVGVAVVERTGVFSPASDIILEAGNVARLEQILRFARSSTRVVRASFGISALYNAAGISIAAAGILSPLICAVLMPLSSLTVLLFGCGMTTWAAKRAGLTPATPS
ncbi:MAG TPA: heavy metal translocating P-type ATPase metal-binding domain-containing protein [Verrucomicrobiae bacterium]|nr:heavy metal translocating P-type ATPase metal-binding domain-containing protein [Verrucomicrobiae bacterium]